MDIAESQATFVQTTTPGGSLTRGRQFIKACHSFFWKVMEENDVEDTHTVPANQK